MIASGSPPRRKRVPCTRTKGSDATGAGGGAKAVPRLPVSGSVQASAPRRTTAPKTSRGSARAAAALVCGGGDRVPTAKPDILVEGINAGTEQQGFRVAV